MKLDSVIFYSHDIEKLVPFYTQTLGFAAEYQRDNQFVSFLLPGGGRLGIKTKTDDREVPGHQTMILSTGDVEKDYDRLKKTNVTFYKELQSYSWGTTFSILDPDGNKIEFLQR